MWTIDDGSEFGPFPDDSGSLDEQLIVSSATLAAKAAQLHVRFFIELPPP
jgi:hypothetical protein